MRPILRRAWEMEQLGAEDMNAPTGHTDAVGIPDMIDA